jgi:Cytidylate kinase-like family
MSTAAPRPPVVTVAALYGAAGSLIAPRVAQRLEVPLLDREIADFVAGRTGLSPKAVASVDDEPRGGLDRLLSSLGRTSTMSGGTGGSTEHLDLQERTLRGYIEEFLARSIVSGGVTVGRGGMVVLRSVPWALHVHLGGPRNARIEQRMAIEGIDRETAQQRQKTEDRTRMSYVRRVYGVDGADPSLYHVMLDSTALSVDACVEMIVAASRDRTQHPKPTEAI